MLVFDGFQDQVVEVEFLGLDGDTLTLKITLGPEDFGAVMAAVKWARENDFWSETDQAVAGIAIGNYGLLMRIKAWEGVVAPDGSPIPCTTEAKMAVLGKYPQVLVNLAAKLAELEAAQVKNSGTSLDG